MRALVFEGSLALRDIPRPVPGPDEALIRILCAGICRTDLEIVAGYMGFTGVLGHEFVGVVESCESEPDWIGTRVVGEINIAPGAADSLARRHAADRTVLGIAGKDGCFAEYITLPIANLLAVPDSISDRVAVFVEPLAAAWEILEQVPARPDSRIAVAGDGKLGLLCAQALKLSGAAVTLFGRHSEKLAIARDMGIDTKLSDECPVSSKQSFDLAVDCTGRPEGLNFCLDLLRPRGILVLKTTTALPPAFNTARFVIDEITLIGSRCGPFAPAVRLLAAGDVQVGPLIEATYPLSEGERAFAHAAAPGALKVLLDMG
jgi:threonine dehydrogenase-like Zn-dependent dehydrogenase